MGVTSDFATVSDAQRSAPRTGYDIVAEEYYDPRHVTSRNFDAATYAHLCEKPFLFPTHGLALDLGAGRGRLGEYSGVDANRIVQADISLQMLKLTERESALGRVRTDALSLPFTSGVFTIVAAFLFDPFNQRGVFEQIARVLSDRGIFVGTIPHYEWGLALRSGTGKPLDEAVFVLKSGERIVRPSVLSRGQQLDDGLTGAGLHVVRNEALMLPSDVKHVSPDIEMAARVMKKSVYRIPIAQLLIAIKT